MGKIVKAWMRDESGATAVEYGALVTFIGLALVVTLEAIGISLAGTFTALKSVFATAAPASGG